MTTQEANELDWFEFRGPKWGPLIELAGDELRKGKVDYTLSLLPLIKEKLEQLENLADDNGKIHLKQVDKLGQ